MEPQIYTISPLWQLVMVVAAAALLYGWEWIIDEHKKMNQERKTESCE